MRIIPIQNGNVLIKSRLSSRAKSRDLAAQVCLNGEIPPLAMLGRDDKYTDIHLLNRYYSLTQRLDLAPFLRLVGALEDCWLPLVKLPQA